MKPNDYTLTIELADMESKVLDLSNKLLSEINEENLKYFSSEVKVIAESALEKYVFDVYDLYTSGALRISDVSDLLSFTDTDNGYQQQMLNWIKQNAISITEQEISIPEYPQKSANKSRHKESFVIGSVIATGLIISGHPWIALVVELLTLAISYNRYRTFAMSEKQYAMKVERYKMDIDGKKNEFVRGVITDLENWLSDGKTKSQEILKTFNLYEKS